MVIYTSLRMFFFHESKFPYSTLFPSSFSNGPQSSSHTASSWFIPAFSSSSPLHYVSPTPSSSLAPIHFVNSTTDPISSHSPLSPRVNPDLYSSPTTPSLSSTFSCNTLILIIRLLVIILFNLIVCLYDSCELL